MSFVYSGSLCLILSETYAIIEEIKLILLIKYLQILFHGLVFL